jgi:hypothetical protein
VDKKSKIFFAVLFLLIAGSVAVTYWRIMIKKDYIIEAQTDCDPTVDECFIWECDPQSSEEGEACTGDPEKDIWYFQVIKRKASNIPLCDPNMDENCEALVCGENEPECEYEFCTQENMEDQYASACNNPEQYLLENPIEEEEDVEDCDPETDSDCEVSEDEGAGAEEGEDAAVDETTESVQ